MEGPFPPTEVKRGRPEGSYKQPDYRDLNPQERKAALLRASGMSLEAIALQLDTYPAYITNILERPHVAKYLLRIEAETAIEIAPVARRLSEEMEAVSGEAFDRLTNTMRRLDEVGEDALNEGDLKQGIRAKLGTVYTAKDILDRAGKRAPTRTIQGVIHAVAPESLEKLERIIKDVSGSKEEDPNG